MTAAEELGHLADIPVMLEIELDRRKVAVSEILEWGTGGVVWLSRSAGENIDIYIGGTLFGSGEIVIIENTFGIRLTDFNWQA